jgi:hypothetical protein
MSDETKPRCGLLPSMPPRQNGPDWPAQLFLGMIIMRRRLSTAVAAAFFVTAASLAARAEDAAPAATPTDSAPASVARPSIVPQTNDTAAKPDTSVRPQADAEPAPRRHRRYARRHYMRYAYWEPFPIFFPYFSRRHGITWSRIPWFF